MSGTAIVRRVGPEAAPSVMAVVREAFGNREKLDPPADALAETEASLAACLDGHRGLLAELDGEPVGAVLLDPEPHGPGVYLRRFGVVPAAQGHGVAGALVSAALGAAGEMPGIDRAIVLAREELPQTVSYWHSQGFGEIARHRPYRKLARALPRRVEVPTASAMRELGERLATVLRAGDVLVLSGELGAGKTTFTQGLGEGLGVRGGITSPTFVISRVHPPLGDGPALVHVDAYRLHDGAELDDLDLDASLDDAVTVVEWGAGLAEALTDAPLEIRIIRENGLPTGGDAAGDEVADLRMVELDPLGARWLGVDLRH